MNIIERFMTQIELLEASLDRLREMFFKDMLETFDKSEGVEI